jgi:hemolysin activation/secretion protein
MAGLAAGAGVLLVAAPVQAQNPAPTTPAAASVSGNPAARPDETLLVQRYTVEGNSLLAQAAIDARLVEFTGRVGLQRMRDAAAAVQELYRRAGYGGVVAFLPEQVPQIGPQGASIRIRVVEGKLTRIDIADNKQFSRENVLSSLPTLVTGRTPQVRQIDAEIQIANENPAKTVQVLLQPGEQIGSVVAKVTVAEQPVQRFNLRLDNTGGERTGRWRGAAGWQQANLWGADHVAALEAQTAPEQPSAVAVLSGSYRVPFYKQALALDAYGAWSDVDAGKTGTAAGDLQFSGRGYVAGLRGTAYLPRWRNIDQRASLGVEMRDYLNDCSIEGLPQGACGSAGESVSVLPLTLSYTAQTAGEYQLGAYIALVHNLGGGRNAAAADFEAVRKGAERRYTAIRGNGSAATAFAGLGVLALRMQGQYTRDALVPGELFGVGGANSVRGYEERELGGDKGIQASLEFSTANLAESVFGLKPQQADIRALLFADVGWVSNLLDAPCRPGQTRCHIESVGLGARVSWQQLQLRLDLARALRAATTTQSGDGRMHLSLAYSF